MKKLYLIAFSLFFAMTSLLQAAPCPLGQKRNAQGKCVKAERVNRANDRKKMLNGSPLIATTQANNAIEAYNQAVKNPNPNATKIGITQTAAVNAINNVLAIYGSYLNIVQTGTAPVVYQTPVNPNPSAAAVVSTTSTTSNNQSAITNNKRLAASASASICDDGSQGMCDDLSTPLCYDNSTADVNGICADGSLGSCNDGTSPVCADGTSPFLNQ